MPVDDGLDLFGMHLEAADVDDAAAPPVEIVALAPAFDHVVGVDEAVLIEKLAGGSVYRRSGLRCAWSGCAAIRPRPSSRPRRVGPRKRGRKSFEAVGHFEADAGLRARIGMADPGSRIGLAQAVENILVGDLARTGARSRDR